MQEYQYNCTSREFVRFMSSKRKTFDQIVSLDGQKQYQHDTQGIMECSELNKTGSGQLNCTNQFSIAQIEELAL